MEFDVVSFFGDRFAIADKSGKIIDDAQKFGYKTRQSAHKAAAYKFGGGKEKAASDKKRAKAFLQKIKEDRGIDVKKLYREWSESCFKDILRGEMDNKDIWEGIEMETAIQIDRGIRRSIEKMIDDN